MSQFHYSRSYRGPLQAVIFDWAGTIVDYGCCAPAVAFTELFRRKGVEITIAEARGPMGTHKKEHIRQISRIPRVAQTWREEHGRPCTEEDIEAMYEVFVPLQVECLADYAELIPGTIEAVAECRRQGMKIGSTTGYAKPMMDVLVPEAKKRGFEPDCVVCGTDVRAGRPEPWMCLKNAHDLGVYPLESIVKVGDTLPDIAEGLNAAMWTIGVVKTGNEIGLSEEEIAALNADDYRHRSERAYEKMYQAGTHYVVDGIAEILPCLDEINARLKRGERP